MLETWDTWEGWYTDSGFHSHSYGTQAVGIPPLVAVSPDSKIFKDLQFLSVDLVSSFTNL